MIKLHERSDDGNAFIPDPGEGPAHAPDELAEVLAEDFLEAATGGNAVYEEEVDAPTTEEIGGPFVVTRPSEEFATDIDESNPVSADREPLPKPTAR
jgi:hypothetical protein